MEKPTLLLIFEKGPRRGETLECKPRAPTRIGRVVKGNTLAIKDSGISQKHLSFQFIPETSRWAVTDLDSSNGTLLNGSQIPPSAPTPLSHGDFIKIGELTTFSVKIFRPEPPPAPEEANGLRARRWRGEEQIEVPAKGGGRGRRKLPIPTWVSKEEDVVDLVEEDRVEVVVENVGRGRRPSKKKAAGSARVSFKHEVLDSVAEESLEVEVNAGNLKKAADSGNASVKEEILELVTEENVKFVNNVRRGKGTRAARSRLLKAEETSASVPVCVTEAPTGAEKVDSRVESNADDGVILELVMEENVEFVNNVRRGRGRGKGTRATRSRLLKAEETCASVPVCGIEDPAGAEKVDSRVESNADDEDKLVGRGEGELRAEKLIDDMENMRVGEWFDRMETYLPQAINDVADEIIASLRKTARRFDEYIVNGSNDGVV